MYRPLSLLIFLFLWVASAQAHRINHLSVLADFRSDGTYSVTLSVEPGKLPVDPGDPFPPLPPEDGDAPEGAAERKAIFDLAKPYFESSFEFFFDQDPITPEFEFDFVVQDEQKVVAEGVAAQPGRTHLFVTGTFSGKVPGDSDFFRFLVSREMEMAVWFVGSVNGEPKGIPKLIFAAEESRPYPMAWAREAAADPNTLPPDPDPEPDPENGSTEIPVPDPVEPGTGAEDDIVTLDEYNMPLSFWERVKQNIKVGYRHIIPKGLDHILFVAGLFLLSQRLGALLWQVTAFTIAHSITLALAYLDIFRIKPEIVEPLIALSIAVVAIENIITRRVRPHRIGLVFCLGLLHGLGFAGAFADAFEGMGVTDENLIERLVFLNIGVELGQLMVIAILLLHFGLAKALFARNEKCEGEFDESYRSIWAVPASIYIAIVALVATLDRVIPFELPEVLNWLQIL